MLEIVSLVGPSYSGKSTVAKGVKARLKDEGIKSDIVKKDDAMRALGKQRYGEQDRSGGYSVLNTFRHGPVPSSELHAWMRQRVRAARALERVVILEGGTRTRTAQEETLGGINLDEDGFRIFMLNLPFGEVIKRSRKRRRETNRYDDKLLIAGSKLIGQYLGSNSADAPQATDPDVTVLDATRPPEELVEIVANEIFESRAQL